MYFGWRYSLDRMHAPNAHQGQELKFFQRIYDELKQAIEELQKKVAGGVSEELMKQRVLHKLAIQSLENAKVRSAFFWMLVVAPAKAPAVVAAGYRRSCAAAAVSLLRSPAATAAALGQTARSCLTSHMTPSTFDRGAVLPLPTRRRPRR